MPTAETNGVATYFEQRGDGPPVVFDHGAIRAADVGAATLREVPGAGHASNLDDPEFSTGALREFLAEVYG